MTSTAVFLTVLAGLAGAVQVAVMGRFGGRVGVLEALTFSTAVQLVLSLGILWSPGSASALSAQRSARRPGSGWAG